MERWGWTAFNLAEVKDSWPTGNRKGFIEVLTCFRGAKATDLRDKVYSLLSLASETYQNTLVPNYSVSNGVADVYIQLANCAADSSHYDRVLAWASTKANVSTIHLAPLPFTPTFRHTMMTAKPLAIADTQIFNGRSRISILSLSTIAHSVHKSRRRS